MTELEIKRQELITARKSLENLPGEIIEKLFLSFPALYSFEIELSNDGGLSLSLHLKSVNGLRWDWPHAKVAGMRPERDSSSTYRAWLLESKLTVGEFSELINTLKLIDPQWFFSRPPCFERSQFVKENK